MNESSTPPKFKYSEVLADWLAELGYTHCFMVAGGGVMHLIDGFRHRFSCVPVVHEMAAGVAAEHFNECSSGGKAFALVTTGPGLTNIITAVAGCYAEHRELLVIAGQVKSTDLLFKGLRQRGMQEVDGVSITDAITVRNTCIKEPISRDEFRDLVAAASKPHPGPVVIEVCLDTQAAPVDRAILEAPRHPGGVCSSGHSRVDEQTQRHADSLAASLSCAKRPVILIGGLVSRRVAWDLLSVLERVGIPVMTTTSAIDRIPSGSPIAAGRPGSWGGQRSANLLIAQADVVVGFGVQWDLQQTGFNWQEYAPNARMFQVFPCEFELSKGEPVLAGAINAEPDAVLAAMLPLISWRDVECWADYIRNVRQLVPTLEPANTTREGYTSPFEFLRNLSKATAPEDVLAMCSSGTSFTGSFQVFEVATRQYVTTSAAFASMGYGLATAIGAAIARPGKRVILVEGDGGFSQSLQELAIVRVNKLPIKIFLFDNLGYSSIRATQRKFFGGEYVGCDTTTGLGFPDWPTLFAAYGIPARFLDRDEINPERLSEIIQGTDPEAWIVRLDPEQSTWPVVASRILPDGKMISNALYQMVPSLDPEIFEKVSKYLPHAVS